MADEKRPNDKPGALAPTPSNGDPFVEIITIIAVAFIAIALVNGITRQVHSSNLLSRGWRGLTVESILLSHTRPIPSVLDPIGVGVISNKNNNVYGSPAGKRIGGQKFNAKGKILQGPVDEGADRYWYVDYASLPDGWVRESDIAYVDDESSLLERIIIGILLSVWWLKLILILFSLGCIAWLAYLIKKLTELRVNERKLLYPQSSVVASNINPQWERIFTYIESVNESDWKLAILEADILLSGLLDNLFLPGETIADKLKTVEKSDFTTIDNAWEAHRIRNQIAHDGEAFVLTEREARRVIELYRMIFDEFHII